MGYEAAPSGKLGVKKPTFQVDQGQKKYFPGKAGFKKPFFSGSPGSGAQQLTGWHPDVK